MSKHSFSLSLEDEDYQALKELAEREDRHIYEQARHMLRGELKRLSGEQEPLNRRGLIIMDADGDTVLPGTGDDTAQEPLPG